MSHLDDLIQGVVADLPAAEDFLMLFDACCRIPSIYRDREVGVDGASASRLRKTTPFRPRAGAALAGAATRIGITITALIATG